MAPPDNGHFAPFGLNAGMMAFLLGHLAHRIRKGERVLKVLEVIAALDAFNTIAMGQRPIWVLGQKVSQFCSAGRLGIRLACHADLLGKFSHREAAF